MSNNFRCLQSSSLVSAKQRPSTHCLLKDGDCTTKRWHRETSVAYGWAQLPSHVDDLPQLTTALQKPDECAERMSIKFVFLRSPLLSPRDPEAIIVTRAHRLMLVFSNTNPDQYQRNSVAVLHFQKFFGTSAVTRTKHESPLSRILTSICVALRMRENTRLCSGAILFKTQAEYLSIMILSMFSSIGRPVYFYILNKNPGSLVTFGC